MAQNNFKPFATGANANVIAQADYEALAALLTGFQAGKASSAQINKALRQSSTVAAMLAQFIADKSGNDVLDNGNIATLQASLIQALKANTASANPSYYTDTGAANNLIITPSPGLSTLTDGQIFDVLCANVNTGAVTLKVNALNAYPVLGSAGALQGGEIGAAGGVIRVVWSAAKSAFLLVAQNTSGPFQVTQGTKSNHAVNLGQLGSAAFKTVGNGVGQIPDMSYFGSNTSSPGWERLPDGFIIQWGYAKQAGQGGVPVSFPMTFPNFLRGIHCIPLIVGPTGYDCITVDSYDKTGMYINRMSGNSSVDGKGNWDFFWMVVGY
ncbi:gp53-like domain-containing protein [Pantoea ananatis]|uniref:gp53-like domain-containing protein n=1 Tax=Pantoea ananas TaxID=553 RepID=UPI003FA49B8D